MVRGVLPSGSDSNVFPDIGDGMCSELPTIKASDSGHLAAVGAYKGSRHHLGTNKKGCKVQSMVTGARKPFRNLPYLRPNAIADIPGIAAKYGCDLAEIVPVVEWLDVGHALDVLQRLALVHVDVFGSLTSLSLDKNVDFMEIFSGCGHWTLAAARSGLRVGPSIDKLVGTGHGLLTFDVRAASDRQAVWAMLHVLSPKWVHIGYPCTFWTWLAHWTRKQSAESNEATRLESLLYIVFARQIAHFQASRGRHVTIENPSGCLSWNLDVVLDIITTGHMNCVDIDLCCWGAVDPGNGLMYKKRMRFGSTFSMSCLSRKCPKSHAHQVI